MPRLTLGLKLNEITGIIAGGKYNACMIIGTDGTSYGYRRDAFGTITPDETTMGQEVCEMSWKADGSFVMSWDTVTPTGVCTAQIPDVTKIIWYNSLKTQGLVFDWNGADAYEATDVDLAATLIANWPDGSEGCFNLKTLPRNFAINTWSLFARGIEEN